MTDFKRVFIDTAPIIYFLENSSLYMELMETFFARCMKEHIQIVTSALVSPYRNGKMEYVDNFKRFIKYMDIEVVDIDSIIAERGAVIRGRYKSFKATDALQIATAIEKKCDMFFTNDKQLRQEKELPCMTIEDIVKG